MSSIYFDNDLALNDYANVTCIAWSKGEEPSVLSEYLAKITCNNLVGGDWNMNGLVLSIQLGMSSSQLASG